MAVISLFPSQEPPSADEQLAEFGLSVELIHKALRPGLNQALTRTSLAPAGAQRTDIYLDGTEQLRLKLARLGWTVVPVDRQERTTAPNGSMAIVVTSADHVGMTGNPRTYPITRQPKGPATHKAIGATFGIPGQEIFDLGTEAPEPEEVSSELKSAPLWMLLHELTSHGLLVELSQPSGYRPDGRVDQWSRRIIIPAITMSDDLTPFDPDDEDGIDISVGIR